MAHLSRIAFIALALGMPTQAHADSPLTSIAFHKAYPSRTTTKALGGQLDGDLSAYLADPNKPIAAKAALINALGWSTQGKKNAEAFLQYLSGKYSRPVDELRRNYAETLSEHEVFCYGYLLAMDDYFKPKPAVAVLEVATRRNPKSYTVHIVAALARAQAAMADDWCQVWKEVDAVSKNRKLTQDMEPAAIQEIFKYMRLYEDSCNKPGQ